MSADPEIRPYRIEIPQADLDDLAARLDATRWPEDPVGADWSYGIPVGYLRDLAGYWRHEYDWRAEEAKLNSVPQFLTEIDGFDVHFIHVRSPEPEALPLVLTHGWPGSIVEFLDLIGPLTDPRAHGGDPTEAFHVVVPTIPGFGFPGPTATVGWSVPRVAAVWAELMHRLGYARYAAHGGDYGSAISRWLVLIDQEHLVALHLTAVFSASARPKSADPTDPEQLRSLEAGARYRNELRGYSMLQSTRPQSIAYGLTDSPVGQLAWIAERFKDWTDSTDTPDDAVDRDELLTNVMIYWLNRTAGSSARFYKESWTTLRALEYSPVPTAVAVFPRDIALPVRALAEQSHNIVRWTSYDRGGHFAGLEVPDLLLKDLRESLRDFRRHAAEDDA
ncbi:epoxide hydrolase family protein [Antrihabitans spumae]|uniref:Epoxide hydrolase family protein n=1 Tax=Antrihabitans spumae TaxID=3373370 RepID=A0ABW7JXJ2_9NOCA